MHEASGDESNRQAMVVRGTARVKGSRVLQQIAALRGQAVAVDQPLEL
jgi:hypothetical protein